MRFVLLVQSIIFLQLLLFMVRFKMNVFGVLGGSFDLSIVGLTLLGLRYCNLDKRSRFPLVFSCHSDFE